MKIIDIGICTDNIDPKGIGRIRCVRYNDYVSEKEKAITYDTWSDRDPFVALPFLPSNINMIPEIGQAVKIINYDTGKETVNQEYMSGPFTTMYDFNSQTFSQQIENISYGIAIKHKPEIRKTTGQYINKKTENAFPKESDYAINGKFGSDILFTENGLQLRGGKLLSKDAASFENKKLLISYPLMSDVSSRIYLKKFPKKMTLTQIKKIQQITESKDLKYIVEYETDSLIAPTMVKLFIYSVLKPEGQVFKTNSFTENTPLILSALKLINVDNTDTTPTYIANVTSIADVYKEIRHTLFALHDTGLKELNTLYNQEDVHPFYFRPSLNFINLIPLNNTEKENKKTILNKISLSNSGPSSGLVWSLTSISPVVTKKEIVEDVLKSDQSSPEQSFAAITSDKMYFLSTDPNKTDLTIDFTSLNKYELTQEDYIKKIDPNTYSIVRGENLIRFLSAFYYAFYGHVHNINKPYVKDGYDPHKEMEKLFETLEDDILNKSIRIN
jgi:hypothetical protein